MFTEEDLSTMSANSTVLDPTQGINEIWITEEMVRKKLATVRQDRVGGTDNILPRLLANIPKEISFPLCKLFNKSMLEGAVPEDWKQANVTPIFKKGSKGTPENYRR